MHTNDLDRAGNRREFLRRAAAIAGAAAAVPATRLWAGAPSDRLGVACVGTGGMGGMHLDWLAQQPDVRVVAVCDVDAGHLKGASARFPDALASGDFREVVGRPDVDVVFVATPDHWHALVGIAAARAGKHLYCEKPLTNSIGEGRALCKAVADAGVVLQTGSMERSNPGASAAKQLVDQGRLGEVHTVRIHLPNLDAHLQEVEHFTTPPPDADPPAGLDYDFWLGHTPVSPYNEKRCHFFWRFHRRYGGGEITDRGAHVIDLAHMILGLDATGPTRVEATGTPPRGGFYDAFITFNFENHYPTGMKMVGDNSAPRGLTLEGTEGKLFVAVHGCGLSAEPPSLLQGVELPRVDPYAVHRRGFLDAVRGGRPVAAGAEAGHRTASACHLINLAMVTGKPFAWDPATELSDSDAVNALLSPSMRSPWRL
ncbi:Inositol 2-dehydrogenase [Pirellulimonas nuda]|uniref:Inositol 2-dehydrogenase n=1 Tax=Pirellulimonas nuda TaxID=2528009 RepID=A0A518DDM2_9BACT|nr:Gfo/Idh/MocA family oxidoreductase [Pirellulimonas nuda]QDU89578.1 Inositol 2-dehydrogenase [Pirellulimonas nuda]